MVTVMLLTPSPGILPFMFAAMLYSCKIVWGERLIYVYVLLHEIGCLSIIDALKSHLFLKNWFGRSAKDFHIFITTSSIEIQLFTAIQIYLFSKGSSLDWHILRENLPYIDNYNYRVSAMLTRRCDAFKFSRNTQSWQCWHSCTT